MCRPQPVAHPTYLYHTLQSHTSSCSYCDLSCLSVRACNSFSFVWLYITCSCRSLCHRRLHHGRSSSNEATADETGRLLWIRAHYCSQRVALPREPQQTHTPSSWFGTHAQVGGTGQICLDDSVHKMRLSVTTRLFSCGGNHDCRSFNPFDYCCSPFQKSLISPKRLSLDKVMRTNILVSSSWLWR
jgi:hypothetical protein